MSHTATAPAPTSTMPSGVHLSFGRLVRSEWIKLRSIRSTWWCYAILVLVTIGMAALLGNFVTDIGSGAPQDAENGQLVSINTAGVTLSALVVGVLGVLIVTGEYGTGQIRSTFTADPRRTGVVLAKATVLAVTTFVVSAVATWIGVALSAWLQASNGVEADLADPGVFLPILGSSVYVTMLALLAYGIGLIVRSSAGGIAITLGILLVLPVVLAIVGGLLDAQWIGDVAAFLPDQAGGQLFAYSYEGAQTPPGVVLDGWSGFGVFAGEVLVVGALALFLARRRDV